MQQMFKMLISTCPSSFHMSKGTGFINQVNILISASEKEEPLSPGSITSIKQ